MTATEVKAKYGLRYEPYVFRTLDNANHFAKGGPETGQVSLWVIRGDDGVFWVVVPADFAKLEKAGYKPV